MPFELDARHGRRLVSGVAPALRRPRGRDVVPVRHRTTNPRTRNIPMSSLRTTKKATHSNRRHRFARAVVPLGLVAVTLGSAARADADAVTATVKTDVLTVKGTLGADV